jgi:transposase
VDGDLLTMSGKERERARVIRQVSARELRQARAAELLGITVRQVKRLAAAWRLSGDAGLVSRQRGQPSNNRLEAGQVERIEAALRERYTDFGATLACEKLRQIEDIDVSVETVRQIQVRLGLWRPKRRKAKRVFQIRERRPRFGELVQIDGSPHAWFEDRGPRCTLIVFIDDATGRLTGLRFAAAETTRAYLETLRDHVLAHGRPLAFYSDRHGIFRVNAKDAASGDGLTEFGRVIGRLGIEQICATTPQAKGRVERANKTLQDRLIKELRLEGISDMASAQAFLPTFMQRHNDRFAVPPRNAENAHRPWMLTSRQLDETLAAWEPRTLSKALTFRSGGATHCVRTTGAGIALRGAKVTTRRFLNGSMDVVYKDRILPYTTVRALPGAAAIEDDKTIDARLDRIVATASAPPPQPPRPGAPLAGAVDGSG